MRGRAKGGCHPQCAALRYTHTPYPLTPLPAFAYHYCPALLQAEILTAITLERVVGVKRMPVVAGLFIALFAAGHVYWGPWIYAIPLTPEEHESRRWLGKRWE